MALVKCAECGNEVSTSAASCPKCGAPSPTVAALQQQMQQRHQRAKPWRLGSAAAIVLGLFGWAGMIVGVVPVDGTAGICFAIVVCGLVMGGALCGLVTMYRVGRPRS